MPQSRRRAKRRPQVRVAAVIIRDNEILLARHERNGKRYWVLPGGGVEYGETLEEALTRELIEESACEIRVGPLFFIHDSIRPDRRRHEINICFAAEIVSGKLTVGHRDKRLIDIRFVPLKRLPRIKLCPCLADALLQRLLKADPAYLGNQWKTT